MNCELSSCWWLMANKHCKVNMDQTCDDFEYQMECVVLSMSGHAVDCFNLYSSSVQQ